MGGRGTFAAGNDVAYTYKTVGKIEGVKVLQFMAQIGRNKIPEEAHSSNSYILLDRNGVFHQYREYDTNHLPTFEIGYHFESGLSENGKNVLHIHEYAEAGIEHRQKSRLMNPKEIIQYKKYFKGITQQEIDDYLKLYRRRNK